MRRRVLEAPLGPKIGYHELDDEKEDADEEWMTGEASQLSGAGTRGSNNWVLKVMLPICVSAFAGVVDEGACSACSTVRIVHCEKDWSQSRRRERSEMLSMPLGPSRGGNGASSVE